MKNIYWIIYMGIGYLAYGWKGLFWGIPLGFIALYGFWSITKQLEDEVVKRIKAKLK